MHISMKTAVMALITQGGKLHHVASHLARVMR